MQIRKALVDFHAAKYNLRQKTKRLYKDVLERFADWCEDKGIELEQIKPNVVHRYLSESTAYSSETLRTHTRVIKIFLSWCSLEEEYESLVSEKTVRRIVLPRREKRVITIFSKNEMNALLKACDKENNPALGARDKAIISLFLDCGLRLSELGHAGSRPEEKTGLRIEDVYFEQPGGYIRVMGKGGKEREVGMGKRVSLALKKYITDYRGESASPFVFLSTQGGGPLSIEAVQGTVERVARLAGVDRAHPHKFRHTFACMYLLAGGAIYTLSRLMGHNSLQITQIYVQAVQDMQLREKGLSVLDGLSLSSAGGVRPVPHLVP